jgi:hypothetical protein
MPVEELPVDVAILPTHPAGGDMVEFRQVRRIKRSLHGPDNIRAPGLLKAEQRLGTWKAQVFWRVVREWVGERAADQPHMGWPRRNSGTTIRPARKSRWSRASRPRRRAAANGSWRQRRSAVGAQARAQVVPLQCLAVEPAPLHISQGARVGIEALAVEADRRREHSALVATDRLSRRGTTRDVNAWGPHAHAVVAAPPEPFGGFDEGDAVYELDEPDGIATGAASVSKSWPYEFCRIKSQGLEGCCCCVQWLSRSLVRSCRSSW